MIMMCVHTIVGMILIIQYIKRTIYTGEMGTGTSVRPTLILVLMTKQTNENQNKKINKNDYIRL